jgi:hypothetical protein
MCVQEGEVQKLSAKLGKFTLPHLNNLMDILDLPRGSGDEGTKVGTFAQLQYTALQVTIHMTAASL